MKKILGIILVLCAFIGAAVKSFDLEMLQGTYYTQIDNSKMEEINTGNGVINFEGSLPYRYTLVCYNQNGKKKELSFTAGKILKEGAFLALEVSPIRGVVSWGEITYEQLPANAQQHYENPLTNN